VNKYITKDNLAYNIFDDEDILHTKIFLSKPYSIFNLFEMIKNVGSIIAIINFLTEGEYKLFLAMAHPELKNLRNPSNDCLSQRGLDFFHGLLTEVNSFAVGIGLVGSRRFIETIIEDLDTTKINILHDNVHKLLKIIEREVSEQLFIHIPKNRACWFNNELAFGKETLTAFSSAREDIIQAGNCYALNCCTASVFHAMRVLEYGLKALSTDVGLIYDVQQWHNIIEEIEKKIKEESNTLPKSAAKNNRLRFLSEAAKEFRYFKDGWRNYVSHGRSSYDSSGALSILNHVGTFMLHLSSQLKSSEL
jgi:hypothetical protein